MGKSLQSAARLRDLSRIVSSPKPHSHRPKQTQPRSATAKPVAVKVESPKRESLVVERQCRKPLARVVADCAKRWFQDTLKEAKAGDSAMQVLVGQMYYSGYGVPRNPQKGHAWISEASRSRNSVWKVSKKRPGYRESDSDSCELEKKTKSS